MKIRILLTVFAFLSLTTVAFAQEAEIEELNPYAPDVEQLLKRFDRVYEAETGMPAHLDTPTIPTFEGFQGNGAYLTQDSPYCFRDGCTIWLDIDKATQTARLYINGELEGESFVSTGLGNLTPNFDKHPDGRIYDRYTSSKYPGGNYNGLGNMPYAVFIRGGFAVHGTPQGNWPKLGKKASHGCIRMHPDNAVIFNRLVREHGVRNVWITVR